MMRVHLRGIVLGVGVLLSVVIVISVFNTLDTPSDDQETRSRHALSATDEEEAGQSPRMVSQHIGYTFMLTPHQSGPPQEVDSRTMPESLRKIPMRRRGLEVRASIRMSPRSSTRLRPQGGARARAGGPGARPGGPGAMRAAGGPGARAGGPGARAGTGGPRARMGGAMARGGPRLDEEEDEDLVEEMEIDETPTEDVEEEEPLPRGRAGVAARGRLGGPAARPRGRALDDDDDQLTPADAPRRAGSKLRPAGDEEEEEEEEEEEKEKTKKKKKEEKVPEPPKKKEPPYPEWWKQAYPRSAVADLQEQFVGDQPLYPECPNFEAGSSNLKIKRYGFVDPPNFMKNSKNPCWFEWNGKKDIVKCVPYFYIIGAPKSGTADLFNRVHGHPSVMAGGSTSYYWWDRLRYGAAKTMKYTREAKRGDDTVQLKEYAKQIVGSHGKNLTKELLYSGKSESIFGDATPTYLTENTQWDVFEGNDGCSEPRVIPANFIRHIFPEARIIVMLRDPIERLYSRFLANVPYVYEFENATASLFHTFVTQGVQTYRECLNRMSVRHCAYNTSLFTTAVVRLSEGMYPVFLEDWFRIFSREQILIFKFEEYTQDVQGHVKKVYEHLNIDHVDDYSLLKLAELPVVRKGRLRGEAGYMLPETISILADFYAPFNMKLADMLGDDKWLFDRSQLPPIPTAPAAPVVAPALAPFLAPTAPVAPTAPAAPTAPVAPAAPPAPEVKTDDVEEKEEANAEPPEAEEKRKSEIEEAEEFAGDV